MRATTRQCCQGKISAVTVPPEFARFLDDAVARRRSGVLGVAAIESSKIAWTAFAGGDDDTVFLAGSLSKTVTSAVVLELVERGELDLDGELAVGTTLRALLGHTSGANVPFCPGYAPDGEVPTLAQSIAGLPPSTTPAVEFDTQAAGKFRYSGGGYALVQQLIETVTDTAFADVAKDRVFDPVGMTRTTFVQSPPRLYPEAAAAGLRTTPADLARFVCTLQSGRTAEAMTTPHVTLPWRGQWTLLALIGLKRPATAGLGLFLRGDRFINLGGAFDSFSALAGSTADGTGAVVMTAGFRPVFALRVLFELEEAAGGRGLRGSRNPVSRLILRTLS
jgi:CubicO group peptidase (beta-lactamase class C family)